MHSAAIVAKIFIINPEGLILTLRRSASDTNRPLTWDLPGGTVDYGEDPTEAVKREVREEAGLDLQNVRIFITKTTNNNKYVIRLLYLAYYKPEVIRLSFEHDQYKWVSPDEFCKLEIPDYYKDCIPYLVQGQQYAS